MKVTIRLAILCWLLSIIACGSRVSPHSKPGEHSLVYQTGSATTPVLKYHLFLPDDYGREPAKQWPLIVNLHGRGERGEDLSRVKIHGYNKIVAPRPGFPFIMVSPLCPDSTNWNDHLTSLSGLMDELIAAYTVDTTRIYLTGLSMGGNGVWQLALEYPHRFAAAVPICGWSEPERAARLKDLPIWAFHGALDTVVPASRSEEMVAAVNRAGGQAKLTIYPDLHHDSWTPTYANDELFEWFLEHRLGE